jgi:hypothetical protein
LSARGTSTLLNNALLSARFRFADDSASDRGDPRVCEYHADFARFCGETLTVQKELMRHASVQTTLNTYGGGMMDSMREAHGRVVKQAMAR